MNQLPGCELQFLRVIKSIGSLEEIIYLKRLVPDLKRWLYLAFSSGTDMRVVVRM